MSVLSEELIRHRMNLPASDPASLVVTPLLQEGEAFDADALDLRLGTHFLLPKVPPDPFYYPGRLVEGPLRVHIPLGGFLVLPAHQTVLGATLEFIKLPFDVSGEILTKSSVARTFVVIETAPWIHPSYRGCLTLEIANVSNTPLLLYPGRLIGQLVLLQLSGAEKPSKLSGNYLGPIYPEPPAFKEPREDLYAIGLRRYRNPRLGSWEDIRVRLSTDEARKNLLIGAEPEYPKLAEEANVGGDVHLEIVVDKKGKVSKARVEAHPLLAQAVIDAVKQWRYKPYLIDGSPVEFETSVTMRLSPPTQKTSKQPPD